MEEDKILQAFWCQLEKAEKPTFWLNSISFDNRNNLLEVVSHRIKHLWSKKGGSVLKGHTWMCLVWHA